MVNGQSGRRLAQRDASHARLQQPLDKVLLAELIGLFSPRLPLRRICVGPGHGLLKNGQRCPQALLESDRERIRRFWPGKLRACQCDQEMARQFLVSVAARRISGRPEVGGSGLCRHVVRGRQVPHRKLCCRDRDTA